VLFRVKADLVLTAVKYADPYARQDKKILQELLQLLEIVLKGQIRNLRDKITILTQK
jgi:hypothetical protein